MNKPIAETKMDLHLKVQEVKYFNPFTRQCGNIQYIASVCLRRLLEFYTDIENYKLHRISFHNHYIYTETSCEKHWFRTYKWKPHTDQYSESNN